MSLTEEEKAYIKKEEELLETTIESLCKQLPVAQNAKINACLLYTSDAADE